MPRTKDTSKDAAIIEALKKGETQAFIIKNLHTSPNKVSEIKATLENADALGTIEFNKQTRHPYNKNPDPEDFELTTRLPLNKLEANFLENLILNHIRKAGGKRSPHAAAILKRL